MALFTTYLLFSIGLAVVASGAIQMTTDIKVLEGDGNCNRQCPPVEERERAKSEIHQSTRSVITLLNTCGSEAWTRVAFVNMTDTAYNCPSGLNLTSNSRIPLRTCGRSHKNLEGCSSTIFNVGNLSYSRVCGRLRGYQYGATSAFGFSSQDIDSYYVDGITLTHGVNGTRQHIWTFAAGLSEGNSPWPEQQCPCNASTYNESVPAFIGGDYFCESGLHSQNWDNSFLTTFHPEDVL